MGDDKYLVISVNHSEIVYTVEYSHLFQFFPFWDLLSSSLPYSVVRRFDWLYNT